MPNLSFAGSAFSKLRKAISGSNYTCSETRPAYKPAPLCLSPTDYALKSWFNTGRFENCELRVNVAVNYMQIFVDHFYKVSANMDMDLSVFAYYKPGDVQVSSAEAFLSPDCVLWNDKMTDDQRRLAMRGETLDRSALLQRMIDLQPFERWLVRKGYTEGSMVSTANSLYLGPDPEGNLPGDPNYDPLV